MTDHLIILAGGASSRMKKSSSKELSKDSLAQANTRSKALILIHNRPMLDYLLYNAKLAGFKHVYIVIGQDDALFKTYYGSKRSENLYGRPDAPKSPSNLHSVSVSDGSGAFLSRLFGNSS